MKIQDVEILQEKAKSRKDGVYIFHDNYYAIKNNVFIAYADPFGECHQLLGSFTVFIGKCKRHERKEVLLAWLKSI